MKNLTKGEIIGEATLLQRINEAVQNLMESDADSLIMLHNVVCGGKVELYESDGGEPLTVDGEPLTVDGSWAYVLVEEDPAGCPFCEVVKGT